jgi:energy-coupling factor transport system permease protein
MTLLTPQLGTSAVFRVNPVAKLGACALLATALVLSIDWVSAGVALAIEVLVIPWLHIPARALLRAVAPVAIAAALGTLTILMYGRPSGATHVSFLLVNVTDGSISLAIATLLRTLAIALPSVVLFLTVDPTDLADGLAQNLRLPARFVIGALAGLRLVGLFLQDRRNLELAQRARGIADQGRIRRTIGIAFSLLVLSIRRGSKLATAMEAKGFGGPQQRTWARESRFGAREWLVLALAALIAAVAVVAAKATGHWNFIGAV